MSGYARRVFKAVYLQGSREPGRRAGAFGPTEFAVDGAALAAQIEGACNEFERDGYAIVVAQREDQPIAAERPASAAS